MATKSEVERLSVVETKVDDVLKRLDKIDTKLDNLDRNFAAKWVQTVVAGLIAAILLGFIGVMVHFFIPNVKPVSNNPTSSQTSTTGTAGTPSANASANAKSDTTTPSSSETSDSGGASISLPKVP